MQNQTHNNLKNEMANATLKKGAFVLGGGGGGVWCGGGESNG